MLTPANTGIVGLVLNKQTPFVKTLRKVIQQNLRVVRHGEFYSEGPSNMPGCNNMQGVMQGGNWARAMADGNMHGAMTGKMQTNMPRHIMGGFAMPVSGMPGLVPYGVMGGYQTKTNFYGNPQEHSMFKSFVRTYGPMQMQLMQDFSSQQWSLMQQEHYQIYNNHQTYQVNLQCCT